MVGVRTRKIELLLLFWGKSPKTFQKSKMGYILKLILHLLISSKNDCSFGRSVLNKEMKAETGIYPTFRRGSSG